MLLRGCLIPIINTTFIELSTTDYLFALFLRVSSWDSTSCTHLARASKSQRPQEPFSNYRKIKLLRWTTNPRKTPRMVMLRCWDIPTPGIQYCRICRNEKLAGKCGLNGARPIENKDCAKIQLSVAVHTRQVNNDVQAYKAQSCVCMSEVILVKYRQNS